MFQLVVNLLLIRPEPDLDSEKENHEAHSCQHSEVPLLVGNEPVDEEEKHLSENIDEFPIEPSLSEPSIQHLSVLFKVLV